MGDGDKGRLTDDQLAGLSRDAAAEVIAYELDLSYAAAILARLEGTSWSQLDAEEQAEVSAVLDGILERPASAVHPLLRATHASLAERWQRLERR